MLSSVTMWELCIKKPEAVWMYKAHKSFTLHWATSLKCLPQFYYYHGMDFMFVKVENNSFESVQKVCSSMKNVKKKISVKMCWLWATAYCTVPPTKESGSLDLCPSIQWSHIINSVEMEGDKKKSRGADGSLRHPIKQKFNIVSISRVTPVSNALLPMKCPGAHLSSVNTVHSDSCLELLLAK